MKKLKCNLGYILTKHKVSVYKLSVELKHIRSTISTLAYNKYLLNKRIPTDLIVGICDYLNVGIDQLFEIVELENIDIKSLIDKICNHESIEFVSGDINYRIYKNIYWINDKINPEEEWTILKNNSFVSHNIKLEGLREWLYNNLVEQDIWIEKNYFS